MRRGSAEAQCRAVPAADPQTQHRCVLSLRAGPPQHSAPAVWAPCRTCGAGLQGARASGSERARFANRSSGARASRPSGGTYGCASARSAARRGPSALPRPAAAPEAAAPSPLSRPRAPRSLRSAASAPPAAAPGRGAAAADAGAAASALGAAAAAPAPPRSAPGSAAARARPLPRSPGACLPAPVRHVAAGCAAAWAAGAVQRRTVRHHAKIPSWEIPQGLIAE